MRVSSAAGLRGETRGFKEDRTRVRRRNRDGGAEPDCRIDVHYGVAKPYEEEEEGDMKETRYGLCHPSHPS